MIEVNNEKIGYLEFRTFISTAPSKLRAAFATFMQAGVRKVIVDTRYNGGGLISVADTFASLLAGPANAGKVQSYELYNQANSFLNPPATTFFPEVNAIDLDAIVFITTDSSASATELVINVLEPYVNDVALVGAPTFGKPVGQEAQDFCDQRLRYVTFEVVNARREGRYFSGLPVDCPADDDFTLPVGDMAEASLAAALTRVYRRQLSRSGRQGQRRLTER